MTIGVFGGTFDPPHLGHLAAAQEACCEAGLDQVLFVPAWRNPLKLDEPVTPPEHRVAMTELAVAGNPAFGVSHADLAYGGPSFTVDLLERLHSELGEELAFVVGMDVLRELHRWHHPDRLLALARLIAVSRPGHRAFDPAELEARLPGAQERISLVWTPGVAISSTELRARVAEGRPIRYLVPDAVADYIVEHRLYLGG
ncbi:MAG TPA: nicotinate-nucleotide adenylyltransferase [Chloroflexota bacterium]|nr:nicotinate-nucleotide adenylyltransferase [Chloroflexota bacterium]